MVLTKQEVCLHVRGSLSLSLSLTTKVRVAKGNSSKRALTSSALAVLSTVCNSHCCSKQAKQLLGRGFALSICRQFSINSTLVF